MTGNIISVLYSYKRLNGAIFPFRVVESSVVLPLSVISEAEFLSVPPKGNLTFLVGSFLFVGLYGNRFWTSKV